MYTETHLFKKTLFIGIVAVCTLSLIHAADTDEDENDAFYMQPKLAFLCNYLPQRSIILCEARKDNAHYEDCLTTLLTRLDSKTPETPQEVKSFRENYDSFKKHHSRLCLYQQLDRLLERQSQNREPVATIFDPSEPVYDDLQTHGMFIKLIINDIITIQDDKFREQVVNKEFRRFYKAGRRIREAIIEADELRAVARATAAREAEEQEADGDQCV